MNQNAQAHVTLFSYAPGFQFSQASLQDFADCPLRFYLRYVRQVAWPAIESEPVERAEQRMLLGQAFHQMVQQHLMGVPEERITALIREPELATWWNNYRAYRPADLPGSAGAARYPELALSAPLGAHRLVAKYDLLLVQPGARAVILDWKTAQRRTSAFTLKNRLQTRVYRYLLVRAGAHLNGGTPFAPEQVEMLYWFAEFPDSPERLPYTAAQFEADDAYLTGLVARIAGLAEADFTLTADEAACRYCLYRSYCDRGIRAGDFDAAPAETDPDLDLLPDFDFEQIAEIAF